MKKIFSIIILFLFGFCAFAQDPQFSQYYQAPLYLNPGFAGITPQQRLVINHRIQWPSLPQAFSTYAASYDIFVNELRSGFGILFTTDKMGSAGWRTTTASLQYSYKVKLTSKLIFSPGISFGYGSNGLDRTKLSMGDGLEYNGTTLDPAISKLGNQNYLDFGSGFLLYTKKLWLGASFMHMNQPNLSVLGDVGRLPMKTSIHGGIRLNMSGYRATNRASYLTPSFIYQMQGPTFSQLDLGINYHIDPISIGFSYRGKPFQKSSINTIQQDAFIIFLGLYFKNLSVGYSYDFTISKLQTAAGGAHEISLIYEFSSKSSDKKSKKKYKLIPCPSFNSKEGFWN
ncbi:PorP/SprF family type IX secretion system membrane protein [Ohtaekwangia sp.]|uniref:PorP/SprF family type IX secretion system membrane protein n=1 Tax=Ohtaekwangia sp. TaxID=2066019 RepID=UPI002F95BA2A